MRKPLIPAILAIALIATLPVDGAFARAGGGGGGLGGGGGQGGGRGMGDHGPSDRGNLSYGRPDNRSDQRLFDTARKECNSARYPSGATPRINYGANSFTCQEPGSSKR